MGNYGIYTRREEMRISYDTYKKKVTENGILSTGTNKVSFYFSLSPSLSPKFLLDWVHHSINQTRVKDERGWGKVKNRNGREWWTRESLCFKVGNYDWVNVSHTHHQYIIWFRRKESNREMKTRRRILKTIISLKSEGVRKLSWSLIWMKNRFFFFLDSPPRTCL